MDGQMSLFGEVKETSKTVEKTVEVKKNKKEIIKNEKKEIEYEGKVIVKVYGQEVLTFEKLKVNENTLEEIRLKLVTELKYPEFSKDRTEMSFDKETGIVVPVIRFQKKG